MNKKVKICFTFIMAGNAYVLISPKSQSLEFLNSDCQEIELAPGTYFIIYKGDSAGGVTITISIDNVTTITKHYPSGIFQDFPLTITI